MTFRAGEILARWRYRSCFAVCSPWPGRMTGLFLGVASLYQGQSGVRIGLTQLGTAQGYHGRYGEHRRGKDIEKFLVGDGPATEDDERNIVSLKQLNLSFVSHLYFFPRIPAVAKCLRFKMVLAMIFYRQFFAGDEDIYPQPLITDRTTKPWPCLLKFWFFACQVLDAVSNVNLTKTAMLGTHTAIIRAVRLARAWTSPFALLAQVSSAATKACAFLLGMFTSIGVVIPTNSLRTQLTSAGDRAGLVRGRENNSTDWTRPRGSDSSPVRIILAPPILVGSKIASLIGYFFPSAQAIPRTKFSSSFANAGGGLLESLTALLTKDYDTASAMDIFYTCTVSRMG